MQFQFGEDEDKREYYVIDASSPEDAETGTLDTFGTSDVRIVVVYQRIK